jgi:hypothetical protein
MFKTKLLQLRVTNGNGFLILLPSKRLFVLTLWDVQMSFSSSGFYLEFISLFAQVERKKNLASWHIFGKKIGLKL